MTPLWKGHAYCLSDSMDVRPAPWYKARYFNYGCFEVVEIEGSHFGVGGGSMGCDKLVSSSPANSYIMFQHCDKFLAFDTGASFGMFVLRACVRGRY